MSPASGAARHIVQGEFHVDSDPELVLTTILGSCVAACLHDPASRVGGMNHFLLPSGGAAGEGAAALRYGVFAMELLVNGLLQRGARRERIEARLFGGARMHDGLTDVGAQNAAFAERFLAEEGIRMVGGSLRGTRGRRIQFWPASGRARQMLIDDRRGESIFAEERQVKPNAARPGTIELF